MYSTLKLHVFSPSFSFFKDVHKYFYVLKTLNSKNVQVRNHNLERCSAASIAHASSDKLNPNHHCRVQMWPSRFLGLYLHGLWNQMWHSGDERCSPRAREIV